MENVNDGGQLGGNVTIDQPTRTILFEQLHPFAIKPDVVRIPFDTIKVIAANVTLLDAGQLPPAAAVVGAGPDVSGARPVLVGR